MIKAQESLLVEMCSLQWTLFRQRQRLWEVFLGRWSPAVIPVTFSGISPRRVSSARGLFASLWCLPSPIDFDVNSNWRSSKFWVLHKDLMLFIACTAILSSPLLLLGWSKIVEMKSRSPSTETPIPSRKTHEVERERSSCKKSCPECLQTPVGYGAWHSANGFERSKVSTGSWMYLPASATLGHLKCHTYVQISHFISKCHGFLAVI